MESASAGHLSVVDHAQPLVDQREWRLRRQAVQRTLTDVCLKAEWIRCVGWPAPNVGVEVHTSTKTLGGRPKPAINGHLKTGH